MMGVEITDNAVIGAQSVVTKSITEKGIYAGSPAKFIKAIDPMKLEEKKSKVYHIIAEYRKISKYHNIHPDIKISYPDVYFNDFTINVKTFEYSGIEDEETDDFRDFIRKYGIRIYTKRPFKSKFEI
jgi:hypothetical protein